MTALEVLNNLTWLRPWWLLALLPLALIAWRLLRRPFARQRSNPGAAPLAWGVLPTRDRDAEAAAGVWAAVVDRPLRLAVLMVAQPSVRASRALLAAMLLVVVALAGPAVRGEAFSDIAYRAAALRVLVVDASPAMNGGVPPAFERVRGKLSDLLQVLPAGQTALIAYADEAYLVVPPTTDAATIALLVPELAPAIMPVAGDRPERALRLAAGLLSRSGAGARDLVWLTARTDLPPAVAGALEELPGVRVSIWQAGVGEASAAASSLRAAAIASGGRYLRLADDGSDVPVMAETLAAGIRWTAEARQRAAAGQRDLGPWLLLLALPLAALALRGGALFGSVCLAGALALPPPVAAGGAAEDDVLAYRQFTAGDWAGAAVGFVDPRWRAVAAYRAGDFAAAAAALAGLDEVEAHYNRGNALARLGDWRGALAAFDAALALRPDDVDALHNRDLIRELLASPPSESPPANDQPDRQPGQAPPISTQFAPPNPPSPDRAPPRGSPETDHRREAESLASQWLRRPPDEPAGLLQRKLLLEHQRRQASSEGRR
jgi:Ca-activated chloride channel family protein